MTLGRKILCGTGFHSWERAQPSNLLLTGIGRWCKHCWRSELFDAMTGATYVWYQPHPDEIDRRVKHIGDVVQAIAEGATTASVEREVRHVLYDVSRMRP